MWPWRAPACTGSRSPTCSKQPLPAAWSPLPACTTSQGGRPTCRTASGSRNGWRWGRFRAHHAFLVSELLTHLDYLEEAIERLSERIEAQLRPFAEDLRRLDVMPEVTPRVIEAVVALARTILVIIYHRLKDHAPYQELGAAYLDQRDREQATRRYVKQLARLGHRVILAPAAEETAGAFSKQRFCCKHGFAAATSQHTPLRPAGRQAFGAGDRHHARTR